MKTLKNSGLKSQFSPHILITRSCLSIQYVNIFFMTYIFWNARFLDTSSPSMSCWRTRPMSMWSARAWNSPSPNWKSCQSKNETVKKNNNENDESVTLNIIFLYVHTKCTRTDSFSCMLVLSEKLKECTAVKAAQIFNRHIFVFIDAVINCRKNIKSYF